MGFFDCALQRAASALTGRKRGTDVFSISSSVVVFVLYCSRNNYTNRKIGAAYVSSVFPILYLKDQNFFQ